MSYCRLLPAAVVMVAAAWLSACADLRLPSQEAMTAVFTVKAHAHIEEPPAPESVPVLVPSEQANWSTLCAQCHVGPHFSSYTILKWGHLDSCIGEMVCIDCHAEELHLTHVRGDKGRCIECHMERQVSIECRTCHDELWHDQHTAHLPGFTGMHDIAPEWLDSGCLACHGSQRWCSDCHGLEMPHPENIEELHPSLVRGQPDVCTNCHGELSCIQCHITNRIIVE